MHYAIIAAGEGSRLRLEGVDTPKPLVRLGESTLIGRLIDIFRSRPDCEAVSVIINPDTASWQATRSTPGTTPPWADADNVIVARTEGSMHSLRHLAPLLKGCGRFCLTTVDTVFPQAEFDAYIDAFLADAEGCDGYMGVTGYVDDEKPLYVADDADGYVAGYFDTPFEVARYVSGGIYALTESALDILDECMEAGQTRMRQFQRALVAAGMRLKAWQFSTIIDVDHAADIDKAYNLLTYGRH